MKYEYILHVHVACGIISFVAGGIAAFAKKGSRLHKTCGKFFAISLLAASTLAVVLSSIRPNAFLFGVGLFTVYLITSGWVCLLKMKLSPKRRWIKGVGIFGLASALFMIYTGLFGYNLIQIVLLIFGAILLIFAFKDVFQTPQPGAFIGMHGGRMGGAFIASITAFSLTNFAGTLPNIALWLLPTLIGSPLVAIAIRKYKTRQKAPKALKPD